MRVFLKKGCLLIWKKEMLKIIFLFKWQFWHRRRVPTIGDDPKSSLTWLSRADRHERMYCPLKSKSAVTSFQNPCTLSFPHNIFAFRFCISKPTNVYTHYTCTTWVSRNSRTYRLPQHYVLYRIRFVYM